MKKKSLAKLGMIPLFLIFLSVFIGYYLSTRPEACASPGCEGGKSTKDCKGLYGVDQATCIIDPCCEWGGVFCEADDCEHILPNECEDCGCTLNNSPQYGTGNQTNSTEVGEPVLFSLNWTDDGLSGYIFSFDNCTGSFVNDSWTEMTGTGNWSNVTKTINTTTNCPIKWKVYANDSYDEWNATANYTFNTTCPCGDYCIMELPYTIRYDNATYCTKKDLNSLSDGITEGSIHHNYILDCEGTTINGTGKSTYSALSWEGHNNTIQNCNITNWKYGIIFSGPSTYDNKILYNNISFTEIAIIMQVITHDNLIQNNSLKNNTRGLFSWSVGGGNIENISIINNTITDSTNQGIYIQSWIGSINKNFTFQDNYIYNNDGGFLNFAGANTIKVSDGSIHDNNAYDIRKPVSTIEFRNINFTSSRKIYFSSSTNVFKYNNATTNGIWLNTSVSAIDTLTRELINWNQSLMKWNDTGTVTSYYDISGLKASSDYKIYDNDVLKYIKGTDSSGVLPEFSIDLSGEHEIKVINVTSGKKLVERRLLEKVDKNMYQEMETDSLWLLINHSGRNYILQDIDNDEIILGEKKGNTIFETNTMVGT